MPFDAPAVDGTEHDDDSGLFATINITPLTDVILVLLVTFMVTSSAAVDAMREGTLGVNLPAAASAAAPPTPVDPLVVGVTAEGKIYLHDQIVDEGQLRSTLTITRQKDPRTPIVVQADGDLQHKNVVRILDLVREAGFPDVGIGIKTEQ
jgi:biopolymer transport protein ExbD